MQILLGMVFMGYGQSVNALYPAIPTSPQAESFKRYGDFAVNNAVGIPDISIPLYEIDHFGYKIPVVLRYNPQPIKQSYNFDIYGYGWGLSVNSAVSRQINHIADERTNFNLQQTHQNMLHRLCDYNCHSNFNFSRDLFSVSLPDGSEFDFYIINNNNTIEFLVSGERHVKIQYGGNYNTIDWFKVTDEKGVVYTFDVPEIGYPTGNDNTTGVNVSWQLSRIDIPHTPYPILLNNETLMQSTDQPICGESVVKFGTRSRSTNTAQLYLVDGTSHNYRMRLLNGINFGNGGLLKIFYKNPSNSAENYVEKIQVTQGTSVLREIIFDSFSTAVSTFCGPKSLRRLRTLTFKGSDNSAPEVYGLEYHSIGVGGSTDHWGYLNGSSQYALPNFTFFLENQFSHFAEQVPNSIYGVSRIAKLSTDVSPLEKLRLSSGDSKGGAPAGSHGILNKITYPTGGYTIFDFELHRFLSQTDYDGNYIHNKALRVMRYGGGFRIASIKNYSSAGVVSGIKAYRYGKPSGYGHYMTGTGEAVADPTLLTYLDFSSYQYSGGSMYQLSHPVPYLLLGLDSYGALNAHQNPFDTPQYSWSPWAWEATLSAKNFRRFLAGRPPVVYDQVTVYDGDVEENQNIFPTGKTVYKYFMPLNSGGEGEVPEYYGNVLSAPSHSHLYNRLLEKIEYSYNAATDTFHPVKKEANDWSFYTVGVSGYQYCNWFLEGWKEDFTGNIMVQNFYTPNYTTIGGAQLRTSALTEYNLQGDSLVNSIGYSYNTRKQLVSKLSTNSNNEIAETTMTYPELSTNGPTPAAIQKMVDKNIISPIIESKTFVQGNIVSGNKTEYAEFPSGSSTIVLPARTLQLEFKPGGPEYALQGEVLKYSPNGNPVEYELKGGKRNVYLWSYGENYMIAEIKNASYAAVAAALAQLGISDIQSQIAQATSPNMSLIDQLRQQLPEAQVTTYTYSPRVGVTSVTQPNGLITSYSYDSSGRLKQVKDHNGNIRSAYGYHFKTEQ